MLEMARTRQGDMPRCGGRCFSRRSFFRGACRKKEESREGGLFVRQGSPCDAASREHLRPCGTADGPGHGISGQGPQQELVPGAVTFG